MTSNAKKQIENNIRLLEEAQEEILKQLERKETDSVLELLENCQVVAIQTGTTIEESEGERVATVVVLEEYCELIYRIHESLCQNRPINTVEIQVSFDELVTRVKKSIQKDIRIRKEVVFLPYKVSMWDSLESVWMAADADPECDAYVIPIPYYDKNPDGSFREEHYEGAEYPDYVPVTHYKDYPFEQRHPDKIYIHNPYDEHNTVTSVHPFFYAKNIKRFTENLVYIPYFVLDEISPDNQAAVAGYQREGFGIYDDTAELDRAIALCDAYYGDASSLVQLCRKAGKPVMIQCVEV